MSALDRYSTPGMTLTWSKQNTLDTWVRIEAESARAQGAPTDVVDRLNLSVGPKVSEVDAEEQITHHDVVAFLNVWRRKLDPEAAGWVHRGMTSSDLVDTANAIRMARTTKLLGDHLFELRRTLTTHAAKHWYTFRVGRTHGQTAELTTWGHRMAEFAFALDRALNRFDRLESNFIQGKMSGPVGDYKYISRDQEMAAMRALGLTRPMLASQVVMRDVYADFVHCLAQVATVIEALALEIRLSSRSDTAEVAEGFAKGQQGSSAMPHKRNPIKAEQLCGLAKLVRAQIVPVMEGVALHHERDLSHSSVERIALEQASQLTDYMAETANTLMRNLVVNVGIMEKRVEDSPQVHSAWIKERMIEAGVAPDVAWRVVQLAFEYYNVDQDLSLCIVKAWKDIDPEGEANCPGLSVRLLVHQAGDWRSRVDNTSYALEMLYQSIDSRY